MCGGHAHEVYGVLLAVVEWSVGRVEVSACAMALCLVTG